MLPFTSSTGMRILSTANVGEYWETDLLGLGSKKGFDDLLNDTSPGGLEIPSKYSCE